MTDPLSLHRLGDGEAARPGPRSLTLSVGVAGEPLLTLPQPPGWQEHTVAGAPPSVRAVLVNRALVSDGFAPNAVLTLEKIEADDATPEFVVQAEIAAAISRPGVSMATEVVDPESDIPSATVNYRIANREVTTRVVAAIDDSTNTLWAATLTVQSADPDDPGYRRDMRTLLDGFRISAPA